MKKLLLLSTVVLSLNITSALHSAVIVLNNPSVSLTAQQPVTAVFTDSNGNTYEQTVYYNPAINGVDIGNSGSYVSVYFPTLATGYLWNNGFWVDQQGYYWNNGNRVYVGPYWNDHWHNYWGSRGHGNYYRGGWGGNGVHVHDNVNVNMNDRNWNVNNRDWNDRREFDGQGRNWEGHAGNWDSRDSWGGRDGGWSGGRDGGWSGGRDGGWSGGRDGGGFGGGGRDGGGFGGGGGRGGRGGGGGRGGHR